MPSEAKPTKIGTLDTGVALAANPAEAMLKARPTAFLWVAADAVGGGDGSAARPLASLQEAVDRAKPGTAIMVRRGEYLQNVLFTADQGGREGAPIWLVSADGPQAATITAANPKMPAIGAGGARFVIVQGFHIVGGKNGIQFSQNGFAFDKMIGNIVVSHNLIENVKKDGIKINGGENVVIRDNVIRGAGDNAVDFVAIVHGVITRNSISDIRTTSSAVDAKGGSADILISANQISDIGADGISIGGWMSPEIPYRPGYDSYEAHDVRAIDNRIERVAKRPVSFRGAVGCVAIGNFMEAPQRYPAVVYVDRNYPKAPTAFFSRDLVIRDNVITRENRQLFVEPGNDGITFENNATGTSWDKPVGADLAAYAPPRAGS